VTSFRKYILRQPQTDNARGDFVTDAKADTGIRNIRSRDQLEDYLEGCGACDGAKEVARLVWDDYQASLTEQPNGG